MGKFIRLFYGTNVISGEKFKSYNSQRANRVVNYVRNFLDESFPLSNSSWKNISKILIDNDKLVLIENSVSNYLKDNSQFIGFNGNRDNPICILMKNNNLHIEIKIDSRK